MIRLAIMAVTIPAAAVPPEAIPKASASGKATAATVIPAKKSLLKQIKKIVAKVIIIRRIKIIKVVEENAAILNVVVLLLATHLFLLMN